ncbi:MAG: hypothetical protein Q8O34_11170 [Rhodocyclaceae bacterium]|nr:hypothetical protein [Rhodocyclaceae bacterium]
MSLVLMFVYWWLVPALVLLAAMALWRRADTLLAKAVVIGGGGSILLGLLWLGAGRTMYYDAKVRELCAKDGGVRVYETVKLPAERFEKGGMVNFWQPTDGENALGPEYVFKREMTYYRRGNPELFRMHTQVLRRSDGKLLGESAFYTRGGGDMPGPWHGSSFMCPELSVANDVLRQVFTKE